MWLKTLHICDVLTALSAGERWSRFSSGVCLFQGHTKSIQCLTVHNADGRSNIYSGSHDGHINILPFYFDVIYTVQTVWKQLHDDKRDNDRFAVEAAVICTLTSVESVCLSLTPVRTLLGLRERRERGDSGERTLQPGVQDDGGRRGPSGDLQHGRHRPLHRPEQERVQVSAAAHHTPLMLSGLTE